MPLRILLFLLLAAACGAHNPDTSYARIRTHADRVELRFAFDAHELSKIHPALDADGDETLSRAELRAATPHVENFLRQHIGIELNGAATDLGTFAEPFWPLDAPDPLPKALWHDAASLFSFPFDKATDVLVREMRLLYDVFGQLGGAHTVLGVIEHGGAAHQFIITQSAPEHAWNSATEPGTPAFFREGVLHIWEGYDHLCFLLALLVACRPRHIVGIVTAFTVAHSITLALAALKIIELPARLVESTIAASILYVAVMNIVRREPRNQWLLTFALGLIHGFGFANVLGELELPAGSLAHTLLLFNLGVEAGQLVVVAVLLPLLLLVNRWRHGQRVKLALNCALAMLAAAWLADRVFALDWMPF